MTVACCSVWLSGDDANLHHILLLFDRRLWPQVYTTDMEPLLPPRPPVDEDVDVASNSSRGSEEDGEEPKLALSSNTLAALAAFLREQDLDSSNAADDDDDDVLTAAKQLVQRQRNADGAEAAEEDVEGDGVPKIVIKYDTYERTSANGQPNPSTLRLALIAKHHSLWAEFVHNAARVLSDMIDSQRINCRGKTCLELGAGAGLPGVIAALNGASVVVISDYANEHDDSLLKAIDINIDMVKECLVTNNGSGSNSYSSNSCSKNSTGGVARSSKSGHVPCHLASVGYKWGYPVDHLLSPLSTPTASSSSSRDNPTLSSTTTTGSHSTTTRTPSSLSDGNSGRKFDLIFLADLIFNRSEHRKLLWTVQQCLHVDGTAWVTFSHHDPMKRLLDLNLFRLAESEEYGLSVEAVAEEQRSSHPFVENDGLDEERGVVYTYKLTFRR